MKLDDLRGILLSERETGRLTAVTPDIFEKGHTELASITAKVYAFDDPFSDEARALIDETLAIRETLQDIFAIRSRKIIALTMMHAEGNYYDREEVKRMIPAEKEMFDQITATLEQCRGRLLQNTPPATQRSPVRHVAVAPALLGDDEGPCEPEPAFDEGDGEPVQAEAGPKSPMVITHPCTLVRVLQDMESFMGVDGRVYSLSKGDIVTLPERNAAVLSERNIVLNINLCK